MVKTITEKKGPCFACSHLMSLVNLVLFIIIAALTAHLVDGFFDGKTAIVALMTKGPSVVALAFFALLASSVGIATSILGFIHAGQWNETARYASLAANMVTLALTWLAASFGIRAIRSNFLKGSGQYPRQATAIASLLIIAMATTLAYNVMLGLFKHVGHVSHTAPAHNTGYNTNATHNNGTLPVHHKQAAGHNNQYDNRAAIA